MTNTYKILGQGLTSELLTPESTVKKTIVYEVPENTNTAVSAINITNAGDEEVTYDLAFVKDTDVSSETENVEIDIYNFIGFVATDSGSNGRYSADGVTWTSITFPGSSMNYGRKVVYGNGRFVSMSYDMNAMGGTANNWATSIDGINWTQIPSINNYYPKNLKYINNKFFATYDSTSQIATSDDGLTWTVQNFSFYDVSLGYNIDLVARDISYGNGKYAAIADGIGRIYYSENLISWNGVLLGPSAYNAIVYGNDKFLAVGGYGFAYSSDAINWTTIVGPNTEAGARSVVYGGGKFVVNGGGGYTYSTVAYSTNGIDWTTSSHGSGYMSIGEIAYANGLFVIVGTNQDIKTSPDAITWTSVVSGGMNYFTGIAAGEEFIIDSYSIPKTLYKHRIVSRKAIFPGETQEIKGGITLSAGDQIRVISSADEIITNVYGVEIS